MTETTSWLVPVRDGARWLGEAVASALAECGPLDEVIVIDDGSRDDPASVLPQDPRVRLERQPPAGIALALERGRALARGALLARLDADDHALPGRMEAQRRALAADLRLGAVGGRARLLGPAAGEGMARYLAWVNGIADPHPVLLVESPLFHPAVTARSRAVADVGGWRQGDFPEDYDLWLRLAGAGWRLANVDLEVVALRDRPERLTRTDPRYGRAAFRRLKMDWLARHVLTRRRRVVVWGAGRTGRPWIRWLLAQGATVPAVLDLRHGGTGQAIPVLPPEAVAELSFDLLLVAVGARGAREEIRWQLSRRRPDLREGSDWFAVA